MNKKKNTVPVESDLNPTAQQKIKEIIIGKIEQDTSSGSALERQ